MSKMRPDAVSTRKGRLDSIKSSSNELSTTGPLTPPRRPRNQKFRAKIHCEFLSSLDPEWFHKRRIAKMNPEPFVL
jgi:hypothetical protein